jgi:hypothetical protein
LVWVRVRVRVRYDTLGDEGTAILLWALDFHFYISSRTLIPESVFRLPDEAYDRLQEIHATCSCS